MGVRQRITSGEVGPSGSLGVARNGLGRDHPDGYTLKGAPEGHTASRRVGEIQRARILAALVEVVVERGAGNVTVAHIVARSGVSRRTFYELFADREDCLLAAFDDAIERIAAVVVPAYGEPARWREKIRAGLTALLEFLDHEPGIGRLAIVETLGAGANALERRRRVLAQVMAAVDEGRAEVKHGEGPTPMAAEGIVGGVLAVLHSRLLLQPSPATQGAGRGVQQSPDGDSPARPPRRRVPEGGLLELTGPLMSMIVLPYLGGAAARRELRQPAPEGHAKPRAGSTDPLRDVPMRLTYRTVRVLTAIAELGGRGIHPSNREIGVASGMNDQGQISKLLSRLHRLGLIDNAGVAPGKGAPNAWALTPKGQDVEQAIR
jgi:AcrR family transcriptional regulator